ncbi:hypothetical protein AV530_006603 [Patagioenas fasciata monilis]|uniref:Uncharacterized protein n=1 Tax=Patagioenas fasciata monilis TaxID=372326 RepID=A0A1V4KH62_PATFA|nr:hypothetical protein AV530_006603 [Patagioenas fasciata monilis]
MVVGRSMVWYPWAFFALTHTPEREEGDARVQICNCSLYWSTTIHPQSFTWITLEVEVDVQHFSRSVLGASSTALPAGQGDQTCFKGKRTALLKETERQGE